MKEGSATRGEWVLGVHLSQVLASSHSTMTAASQSIAVFDLWAIMVTAQSSLTDEPHHLSES